MIVSLLLAGCGLLLIGSSVVAPALQKGRWANAGMGALLLLQAGVGEANKGGTASVTVPLSSAQPSALRSQDAKAWLTSSASVQQATATEWLKTLRKRGAFILPIRSEAEYALWATALSQCLNHKAPALPPTANLFELAESQCLSQLKQYRYGTGTP